MKHASRFLGLIALLTLATPASAQNYTATAGAGLTFGAKLSAGVLYPQQTLCDPTTPANCVAVNASGQITVLQGTSPWIAAGGGTAGTAATGVMTVQGIASMTPLFVQSSTVPISTMNSTNANTGMNVATACNFDDTSPTALTENNFGFARCSVRREAYTQIRDAAGNERGANVDASNRLVTAPTLVSGSVASGAYASGAFASGALAAGSMVDLVAITGTKAAGVAAASSALIGGVYNTALPTLTNGQQSSAQFDSSGRLIVNVGAGGAGGGAVYGPTAKGAAAANPPVVIGGTVDGTATGAVGVAKVDASGTVFTDAVSGGTLATTLSSINTNVQAPIAAGTNDIGGVYNAGRNYETVSGSATGQVLGPTGATGDYLSHCVIYPTTTSPGVVTVFDNTSSSTNNVIVFPGGATSVSNLVPFAIPVGAVSVNGAWKVTTGTNVTVTCHGKFT